VAATATAGPKAVTAVTVPRVDIGSLRLGRQFGSGGQGRVMAVDGYRINGRWPAALKIYSPSVIAEIDSAALEQIAALPERLADSDSGWLLQHTAWPAVIVEDRGAVCGFLMRAVPSAYYFSYHTQTLGTRQHLADMAFLLNPDDYLLSSGLAVSDRTRVLLLVSTSRMLSRLHGLGVAVGDLSPKNLLFSLEPTPDSFLIDCDAVRFEGASVFRQIETPDWEAPAGEPKATAATDAYKFGLLAIRLMARDQSSHDLAALSAISQQLGDLGERSLDRDPQQRLRPEAWTGALIAAAASASSTPPAPPPRPDPIHVPSPAVTITAPPASRKGALVLAGAALAIIIVLITALALHSNPGPSGAQAAAGNTAADGGAAANVGNSGANGNGTTGSPSPPTTTAHRPVKVGSVAIAPALADNPQARDAAKMFRTYFSGINHHDYSSAISVFDPAGSFSPYNPDNVRAMASGLATTTDSRIVLARLQPSSTGPARKAEVRFRSHQAAGYGPSGNVFQTCTKWDLEYTLSYSAGKYLIDKVKGTHTRC